MKNTPINTDTAEFLTTSQNPEDHVFLFYQVYEKLFSSLTTRCTNVKYTAHHFHTTSVRSPHTNLQIHERSVYQQKAFSFYRSVIVSSFVAKYTFQLVLLSLNHEKLTAMKNLVLLVEAHDEHSPYISSYETFLYHCSGVFVFI